MNTKKKFLFILACIWLCISLYMAQNTYAKYVSNVSGSADIGFSIWYIKVNNQDILDDNNISDTLVPVFPATNYIAQNVIVPGSEGYFDITIDSSLLGMPFSYNITTALNINNQIPDLVVCGYAIDNGTRVNFTDFTNTEITGTATEETDSVVVRVFVKWNDDNINLTSDVGDTAIAIGNGVARIDVNIQFEQIIVEEEP